MFQMDPALVLSAAELNVSKKQTTSDTPSEKVSNCLVCTVSLTPEL